MLCDGNPDPLNTCDLNTFMNLWRDDNEYKPVPVVLGEGEGTLKVIKHLYIAIQNVLLLVLILFSLSTPSEILLSPHSSGNFSVCLVLP